MRQIKMTDTLMAYCIIFALASLLIDELLVHVIGAPNDPFILMIAEFCGISVSATVICILWVTKGTPRQ